MAQKDTVPANAIAWGFNVTAPLPDILVGEVPPQYRGRGYKGGEAPTAEYDNTWNRDVAHWVRYTENYHALHHYEAHVAFTNPGASPGGADLEVTESVVAAMTVDVATGRGWNAGQGREYDAIPDVAITAADATQDRIDLVYAKSDGTIFVSEGVLAPVGTAVPNARLDENHSLLAEVLVGAAVATIVDANITDRRERGSIGYFRQLQAGDSGGLGNYTLKVTKTQVTVRQVATFEEDVTLDKDMTIAGDLTVDVDFTATGVSTFNGGTVNFTSGGDVNFGGTTLDLDSASPLEVASYLWMKSATLVNKQPIIGDPSFDSNGGFIHHRMVSWLEQSEHELGSGGPVKDTVDNSSLGGVTIAGGVRNIGGTSELTLYYQLNNLARGSSIIGNAGTYISEINAIMRETGGTGISSETVVSMAMFSHPDTDGSWSGLANSGQSWIRSDFTTSWAKYALDLSSMSQADRTLSRLNSVMLAVQLEGTTGDSASFAGFEIKFRDKHLAP